MEELKQTSEEEMMIQENRNLAIVSKLINSSVNKTVQDTIISMFGEMKEGDAILVAKKIPLICERIGVILDNQKEVKLALDKKEDDHETRLRTLETFMNTLIGKMAMIAIGSSVVVSVIIIGIQYFLSKH